MRTVFVANSDPNFISEFRSVVDWSKFDYKIVGFSDNGTKAMGEILRKRPDLVFISNNLQGLSGIEIIERIHGHGLLAEFVLMEDNEDFKLAQKAMRLGVREFLINPVPSAEIIRVLSDFLDRYQAHHSKDMESYLVSTKRLLRNSFMRNFVSAEEHQHFSIEDLNNHYHFTFHEGFFQGALIQLRNLPKEEEGTFLTAITEELRFRFDPICYEMIPFIQGATRLTLLFNYSEESDVSDKLVEIHDIIKDFLKERNCSDTSYSIGIGYSSTDVNALQNILHSAERAAYCEILQGSDKIFFIDQQQFDDITKNDIITPEFINDMRIVVETMNIAKYEALIKKAFDKLTSHTDPEIIVEICRIAIIEVAKACQDADAVSQDEIRKILYNIINAPSLAAITQTLVNSAALRLEAVQKEREFSRPVREATKFIKNNFTENLTLANVADHVHLNASYLSMLFKKETGQNYMGFLTECRIEEAKKLLKDSSMSVAEICYAVGYTDKKHFSRLFIQHVGIRPTAYRSLH